MRQGQQNRRGRGRNRKGQSPLTRSFESTGPDVKIRGTPAHIAEKYMSLARDASSSGDPVLAENYLQHAEHYNRIIMAFRDQQLQSGEMNGAGGRPPRPYMGQDSMEPGDEYSDDDGDDGDMQPRHPPMRHSEPQPRVDGQRFEGPRGEQRRYRERPDRREGGGSGYQNPRQQNADIGAEPGGPQPAASEGQPRRRERFAESHEQPEFLRRPVRRPRRESAAAAAAASEANGGAVTEETDSD
jgi:Domain of unknown function (DUF4167)